VARDFSGGATNPPHLRKASASLGLTNGCSIACWFASDVASGGPRYIAGWGNGSRILALVQSGSRIGIGDKGSGSPINGSVATANSFTAGTWNHAVGIVVSDGERRVVLNGDLANQGTVNPFSSFVASTDAWVGANIYELNGFAGGFNGRVAHLGIYTEILPDDAIIALSLGAHPLLVRPHKLRFLADLSGRHDPEIERIGGAGLPALNSPGFADGPRLFRPRRRLMFPGSSIGTGNTTVAPTGVGAAGAIGQAMVVADGGHEPPGVSAAVLLGQAVAENAAPQVVQVMTGAAAAGNVGMPSLAWGARVKPSSHPLATATGSCRVRRGGWVAQPAVHSVWDAVDMDEAAWQPTAGGGTPWVPAPLAN
jgi:hypothetical protein